MILDAPINLWKKNFVQPTGITDGSRMAWASALGNNLLGRFSFSWQCRQTEFKQISFKMQSDGNNKWRVKQRKIGIYITQKMIENHVHKNILQSKLWPWFVFFLQRNARCSFLHSLPEKTGRIVKDNSQKTEHHKSTQHAALATNHDFEDLLLVVYEGPT